MQDDHSASGWFVLYAQGLQRQYLLYEGAVTDKEVSEMYAEMDGDDVVRMLVDRAISELRMARPMNWQTKVEAAIVTLKQIYGES